MDRDKERLQNIIGISDIDKFVGVIEVTFLKLTIVIENHARILRRSLSHLELSNSI